jgi:hypothetical protein
MYRERRGVRPARHSGAGTHVFWLNFITADLNYILKDDEAASIRSGKETEIFLEASFQ